MKIELPQNIDPDHPECYILTIRVHQAQFSFSLYDPVVEGSYYYRKIGDNRRPNAFFGFKEAFFDNDFLALPFRKVQVLNYTPGFTFVPSLIFEEKNKEVFLNSQFYENNDSVLSQQMVDPEITILHRMQEDVYEFFQRSFLHPVFIHHQAPLIAYFYNKNPENNVSRMILNLQGEGMDILCFSHDQFILGNHFVCKKLNDVVYYILFIWKQLRMNQQKDFLFITGDLSFRKELKEELKVYLRYIMLVDIPSEAHFAGIDTHAIPFELSALSVCEL